MMNASAGSDGSEPGKTIMVVDDEPVIRETVLEILREEGFDAVGMSDGAAALDWAQKVRPDVILSDVVMPGLNGIEMAIKIRELLPGTRIILFSGHGASTAILEQARLKGHEFEIFAKPIDPEVLLTKLRSVISD
ncbi:MAG: response regulator [Acidobacteriaceae bacterium]